MGRNRDMMGWNKVAVVGTGMTEFGELFDLSLEQLAAEAFVNALDSVDKGIAPDRIDTAYFANVMGSLQGNEIPSGATLANAIGMPGIAATRIENGCPTGSDAFRQACLAVASGVSEVAVVVGAEKLRALDQEQPAGVGPNGSPCVVLRRNSDDAVRCPGDPSHARIRHHGRTDGAGCREELGERQPESQRATQSTDHR